jgi:lysophospholipase L1-like esterase
MHRTTTMKRLITKLFTCALIGWTTIGTAQNASTLAQPKNPERPSLFIIGDSTVRNGNGTGAGGQWGWGDFLADHFNTDQLDIVNNALGGTSSRTFYRDRWPGVKAMIKPGDFMMMQFGHNDSGPINEKELGPSARARGTIDGTGPEVEVVHNILTKRVEVVHSYGWYLEQFIAETRALGATPIVCSLIPRNTWKDGRVVRSTSYAKWAEAVAQKTSAPFVDLNGIIANAYDQQGNEFVNTLFVPGAGPHTSEVGAKANAVAVISGLKGLSDNPLENYLSKTTESIPPAVEKEDDRPIVDDSKLKKETTDDSALPTLFLVGDSTVRIGG